MKKKDIEYRTCLVIGILTLISLSSCAHTICRLGINSTSRAEEPQSTILENNTNEEPVTDNIPNQNYEQAASSSERESRFYRVIGRIFSIPQRFAGTIRELGAAAVRRVQANQYIAEGVVVGAAVGYLINAPINNFLNERIDYTFSCPR